MEDLVSSPSFSRSVLSFSEGQAQSGDSSWTDYFVDFMLSEEEKKRQDANFCCATEGEGEGEDDVDGSSHAEEEDSMISDAASHAPVAPLLPAKYRGLKKLRKAFKPLDHDDSLEDTASSPVNSPKVSVVSQLELSPKRRCNIRDLTKEAGIGDDHGREGMDCTDAAMEGVRFGDQSQTSIAPCAELKDKGICLFPLSVLLHYHGRTN
ncbi:unnamed protein product [Urochloa humidicola]